jgi:hypothetical protein
MNADLEALAGEVKAADTAAAPLPPPGQPGEAAAGSPAPAMPDPAARLGNELTGLALMLVEVLGKPFPSLKTIYTPQVTAAAGEAVARVAIKHGWLLNGLAGGYGEELAAAMILMPLGYQTFQGVTKDLAMLKARHAGAEDPASPPPAMGAPGLKPDKVSTSPPPAASSKPAVRSRRKPKPKKK